MLDTLSSLFSYGFMQRAFIVGLLVSPCAALLGVSLVLKKYAMIGDGLSHVGFGALSLALALGVAPLKVSIPIVLLAAFFLLRLGTKSRMGADSAIALVSTGSIAIGVIIASLTKGMSTDVYDFMFGSILAITNSDLYLCILLSLAVLILFIAFYHKIFSITFDENFARASGMKTQFYTILLALLTALTIVIGMRIMGTMLISSLIIFPALTAMRVFRSFRGVTICAAILSLIAFVLGLIASFLLSLPTGASIVIINILFFILFDIVGKIRFSPAKK